MRVRLRTGAGRLVLPLLAILSAFIVGAFVLVLSDLDFYAKFGSNPLGTVLELSLIHI